MSFNKVAFWVQIHNVPLLCMMVEIGKFLGGIIGEVKDVDEEKSGDCVGKYIRVRVIVNVDKPLRHILRVDVMRDGKESTMLLRYERLLEHCYQCGRIGHVVWECELDKRRDGHRDSEGSNVVELTVVIASTTTVGEIVVTEGTRGESNDKGKGADILGKESSFLEKKKDLACELGENKVGEKDTVVPKKKKVVKNQSGSQPIILDGLMHGKENSLLMTLPSKIEKVVGPNVSEGVQILIGLKHMTNEIVGSGMGMEVDFEFGKNSTVGQENDQPMGAVIGGLKESKQYDPKMGKWKR
ncbi:hypothetical protein EZV62_016129 [Acer yangbiense]|uniref:CCHC-type domain-containing protein n=1 Tax=Acer yangbiense TaxID=1000413 RepID=A0A5C7HMN6_9ROSI|nr:hypothetical protein EZV62_016129 [Acer yangbiense]